MFYYFFFFTYDRVEEVLLLMIDDANSPFESLDRNSLRSSMLAKLKLKRAKISADELSDKFNTLLMTTSPWLLLLLVGCCSWGVLSSLSSPFRNDGAAEQFLTPNATINRNKIGHASGGSFGYHIFLRVFFLYDENCHKIIISHNFLFFF